jgi:hypothetical protein
MVHIRRLAAILFAVSALGLLAAMTIEFGPSDLAPSLQGSVALVAAILVAVLFASGGALAYLQVVDPHPLFSWDFFSLKPPADYAATWMLSEDSRVPDGASQLERTPPTD